MPLSVDKPRTLHRYPGFTAAVWQCHPESRGRIDIVSNDPAADPLIDPNYLTADLDQKTIIAGIKMLRDIYQQAEFRHLWDVEMVPDPDVKTDDEILDAARSGGGTVYHCTGTCRMGVDDGAVVTPDLKVRGVDGLRVVDASVMPVITSANTNAPTYMIAEKAAEIMLSESWDTPPVTRIDCRGNTKGDLNALSSLENAHLRRMDRRQFRQKRTGHLPGRWKLRSAPACKSGRS